MKNYILHQICKLILLVLLIPVNSYYLKAQIKEDKNTLEILFIGSSYFNFNDLPGLFEKFIEKTDKEVFIDRIGENGMYLSDHAESITTEEKIKERKWDFIILQGVGSLMAYPDYYTHHPVYPALVTLKEKIIANCPSTRIIFCLPWAFEDGMNWVGWPDTFEDMQILIYNRTLEYANDIGFTIAPVGWVWYKILEEKNYPLHYLHLSDWNHPSLKGSYVMANTIFSTIYIESTINNPYNAGIEIPEANFFKTTASNTVLEGLDLWKITPYIDTTISEHPDTTNSDTTNTDTVSTFIKYPVKKNSNTLYQNYPNPFKTTSLIKYDLQEQTDVEIFIVDLLGNKQISFINKKQLPGSYSIKVDANLLKNGTYFYCLKTNRSIQTKLMQVIK